MEELVITGSAQFVDRSFWQGRRVLVTGHSGFKGGWLSMWLAGLGAHVTGLSLPPSTKPSLFEAAGVVNLCDSHFIDIRDPLAVAKVVNAAKPEIVFHLAAQPLVRESYREPLETFATNVMGTAHLLDAVRQMDGVRAVVAITTDKVYRNRESPWPYREDDAIGGHDPYSASKAACEIVIESYRKAFLDAAGIAVSSARAGNVIGGGDWSAERLLPDAVSAWQAGQMLSIRRPDAIRPWQHVLEPLSAYLRLAQALCGPTRPACAYNFGPHAHEAATVREVVTLAQQAYGSGEVQWGSSNEGPHEAGLLTLETSLARSDLGIEPRWTLPEAVRRTMHWYRAQAQGASALELCQADIDAYEASA